MLFKKKNKTITDKMCDTFINEFKDYINNNKNTQQSKTILREKYHKQIIKKICDDIINFDNCKHEFVNSLLIPIIKVRKEKEFHEYVYDIVDTIIDNGENINASSIVTHIVDRAFCIKDRYIDFLNISECSKPLYKDEYLTKIVHKHIDECVYKNCQLSRFSTPYITTTPHPTPLGCTSLPYTPLLYDLYNDPTKIHEPIYVEPPKPDYTKVMKGELSDIEYKAQIKEYLLHKYKNNH